MLDQDAYKQMKKLVNEHERKSKLPQSEGSTAIIEEPYLITYSIKKKKSYNINYGDERICKCGHSYYRHFDSYERMSPVGCKYCSCFDFKEDKPK